MRKLCGLLIAVLVALLAACGGGGGSGGTPSNGGGGSGGGSGAGASARILLEIVDGSGAVLNSIVVGGSYRVRATVTNAGGAAVANARVAFSLDAAAIAALDQASALTDASGVAFVPVAPASVTAAGAATATGTVDVGGATVEGKVDFAVAQPNLALSAITLGSSRLQAGGNTTLAVTALVNNTPSTGTSLSVNFTASCGSINGADATGGGVGVATNGSGVASVAYSAVGAGGNLCAGTVNIVASSTGAPSSTAALDVAAPVANALAFVSAAPGQVFIAGSGAAEQSVLTFRAFAANAVPLAGVEVVFSIETNPGGVGINASAATAPVRGITDQNGNVTVSVYSGTIPGPVKVRAALASTPTVFAESQNLTVASGVPSQRFMSLSVGTSNIEGWTADGASTALTVRIADRQGNAVPDGTTVNFTAEGGQVGRSCFTATTNNISSCSVVFVSQNPRPEGGRVSVLAHLEGAKDYDDNNQNNIFDAGDTLRQIGDAYRDDNENNAYDLTEFVVPRDGVLPCTGAGGAFPSRANTCAQGLATTVRQQAVILFSSSAPVLNALAATAGGISFQLGSFDNPLLPMPAGTTVTATPLGEGCSAADIAGSPVANVAPAPGEPARDLTTPVAIGLRGCSAGQAVNVRVTSPGGLTTAIPVVLQ